MSKFTIQSKELPDNVFDIICDYVNDCVAENYGVHSYSCSVGNIEVCVKDYNDEEEILWEQYIIYLREWAKDHKDPYCYGMSPACFEEWLNNELEESEEE